MSKVLQRLDILLFANTAQYRSEMRDTQESTTTMFGAIKKDVANMAKVGAAAFATMAAAGTVAIGVLVKEQVELGNEIANAARKANTSVKDIQKMGVAAKAAGIGYEGLAGALEDTQEAVGDFLSTGGGPMADFFENIAPQIGVTAEQFRDLSGPDALQMYYDSVQKANLSQSEMIFYMKSISEEAAMLIPYLHDGGEGFDVWYEAAKNAGAIMDEETIRATKELQVTTDLLELSTQGAKNQFVSGFIPVLSDVATKLTGSESAADAAYLAGQNLAVGFKGVAKVGIGVVAVFDAVGSSIGGVAATIGTLMTDVEMMDGGIEIAIKMARNFKAAGEMNYMVDQDIRSKLLSYGDMLNGIDELGTGVGSSIIDSLIQQKNLLDELNEKRGLTGQQTQANADAADVAAKASAKAAAATLKATEKQIAAQARLVGIAGNSGIGTGSHIDIRYASGDPRKGSKPSQSHINRFEVNGKTLGSLTKTSDFNLKRKHPVTGKVQPHYGVDYDSEIGDNITTKVPVKDVKAWYDSKGGGYVTTVTFADGVKMNLLHQTAASKNIKGGASAGAKNTYSQATNDADQLFKQQAAAEERHQAELARIAEQQSNQRTAIRYEYANKAVQIETRLANEIEKIDASGFNADEAEAFRVDATERAGIELANYHDTQSKKLASLNQFALSERDIINQTAQYRTNEAVRDLEYTTDARTQALEFIEQERLYKLNVLDLAHDQQMQYATQLEQTDIERITNQYALERREIQLTINMDEQLRKAKIDALNQAEQMALSERRYAYESELRQLTSFGQSDLAALRADYANQRRFLDNRTDIDPSQISELRNASKGRELKETRDLQKNALDGFNAQNYDMSGIGANYGLAQQYQQRLKVIEDAVKAEVIAVEQAEQAKYNSRLAFESAATQLTLNSSEAMIGSLAGSLKTMLGEQNTGYQLLFAGQQAFVMASAGLNMYEAWGDAMAEGATLSQKFASAAVIATEFGRIITAASSMTLELPGYQVGGFTASGGDSDPVGLVHANEFVANAPTTRKYRPELEAMHNGTYDRSAINTSNVNVNVTVNGNGSSSVESDQKMGRDLGNVISAAVTQQLNKERRQGGMLYGR